MFEKVRNRVNGWLFKLTSASQMTEAPKTVGQKLAVLATSFFAPLSALALSAHADWSATATDGVSTGITSGMEQVFNVMKTIAVPIAAVCLAICGFYIFAGGEKGMEKAKKIGLYTAIGVAIVFLGPLIIETVAGWFSDVGTGNVFNNK